VKLSFSKKKREKKEAGGQGTNPSPSEISTQQKKKGKGEDSYLTGGRGGAPYSWGKTKTPRTPAKGGKPEHTIKKLT